MPQAQESIRQSIEQVGQQARTASRQMAAASTRAKNQALTELAQRLESHRAALKAANAIDLRNAAAAGCDAAFIDRLTLSDKSIDTMIEGVHQIVGLADPIGDE